MPDTVEIRYVQRGVDAVGRALFFSIRPMLSTEVVNTFGGHKLFGGKEQKPHWDSKGKTDCRSRNQKVGVKAEKEDGGQTMSMLLVQE